MPLTSPPRWALEKLVTDVTAYFAALVPPAVPVALGTVVGFGFRKWKETIDQGTGRANRVIILPCDPSLAGGVLTPPRGPGWREMTAAGELMPQDAFDPSAVVTGRVRAIADWVEQPVISVWAFDSSNPNDDLTQYKALVQLVEWTMRAVESSALANMAFGPVKYAPMVERRFGLEVLISIQLQSPLYDVPLDTGTPAPVITEEFTQ